MDLRKVHRQGVAGIEFTWEGNDECDVAGGRGWATLSTDGSLTGRIFIHHGDDQRRRTRMIATYGTASLTKYVTTSPDGTSSA